MTAHQAPPSLGFSRQEHWSGLPFHSPMYAYVLSRFSHVQLHATLWTAAHQAPLSTGVSRQEYWSGLPFPTYSAPLSSGVGTGVTSGNEGSCFSVSTFLLTQAAQSPIYPQEPPQNDSPCWIWYI